MFNLNSWHSFFIMGGYAVFVWPSYALVLSIFIVNRFLSHSRLKKEMRGW